MIAYVIKVSEVVFAGLQVEFEEMQVHLAEGGAVGLNLYLAREGGGPVLPGVVWQRHQAQLLAHFRRHQRVLLVKVAVTKTICKTSNQNGMGGREPI